MSEDLVGYVCGVLEEPERRALEARLLADPATRQELARVGAALEPLAADGDIDPPPGLARRTIAAVRRQQRRESARPVRQLTYSFALRRLTDLAVAASIIAMCSLALLGAHGRWHEHKRVAKACQRLRAMCTATAVYSEPVVTLPALCKSAAGGQQCSSCTRAAATGQQPGILPVCLPAVQADAAAPGRGRGVQSPGNSAEGPWNGHRPNGSGNVQIAWSPFATPLDDAWYIGSSDTFDTLGAGEFGPWATETGTAPLFDLTNRRSTPHRFVTTDDQFGTPDKM